MKRKEMKIQKKVLLTVSVLTAACVFGLAGSQLLPTQQAEAAYKPVTPRTVDSRMTWDCVNFGSYNGQTIRWRVLDADDTSVILLSDQSIGTQAYDTPGTAASWEASSLRAWLNGTFYKGFSKASSLLDVRAGEKVSLLSKDEVSGTRYGFGLSTLSSDSGILRTEDETAPSWWLTDTLGPAAYLVNGAGAISFSTSSDTSIAVRPIIKVSSATNLSYAGKINSLGELNTDGAEESDGEDGEASHVYADFEYGEAVSSIDICPGGSKETKSQTVYTDITASYIYKEKSNGTITASTGKVIACITKDESAPELNDKGTAFGDEDVTKEGKKYATVSISSGKIVVTAQKSTADPLYLHIRDTGNKGVTGTCQINIKAVPATIYTYAESQDTYDKENTTFKKADVELGEDLDIYFLPTFKSGDEVETSTGCTYTASITGKYKDYFEVVKQPSEYTDENRCTVRAKALYNHKKTSATVEIKCDDNGKKATFTIYAINKVRNVEFTNASGVTKVAAAQTSTQTDTQTGDTQTTGQTNAPASEPLDQYVLPDATKAAVTGTITVNIVLSSGVNADKVSVSETGTTDSPKIYVLGDENAYSFTDAGAVKLETPKATATQKRITATLKNGVITLKATKGTKNDVITWFMLVYNTSNAGNTKAYKIFSVSTPASAPVATPAPTTEPTQEPVQTQDPAQDPTQTASPAA